jgi:hypothetical protein
MVSQAQKEAKKRYRQKLKERRKAQKLPKTLLSKDEINKKQREKYKTDTHKIKTPEELNLINEKRREKYKTDTHKIKTEAERKLINEKQREKYNADKNIEKETHKKKVYKRIKDRMQSIVARNAHYEDMKRFYPRFKEIDGWDELYDEYDIYEDELRKNKDIEGIEDYIIEQFNLIGSKKQL